MLRWERASYFVFHFNALPLPNYPTLAVAISSCPIPTLMNGSVNFASTSTCSVATYQCNGGFRLLGPSNQTCVDGRWVGSSSSSPVCKGG